MADFTSRWSFAATPVVGIEIPQSPVNADIGSYGYRTVGIAAITCAVGVKGALTVDAVDGDATRDNAEVLTIVQLSSATPNYSAGCLVRGSGAVTAEQGYAAYIDEATGIVRIIKIVAGTMTTLASSSAKTLAATAQDWYLRFRANGTTLSAKAWRYGVPEPTAWDVTLTDGSITGVGFAGLFSRCLVANNLSLDFPGFVSVGTNGETAPRPRSELEFRDWANNDSNQRVVLCELGVLGQTTGAVANASTALLSTVPFTTRGSETPRNQVYDDIIVSVPTFSSKVSDATLTGRPSQAYGDLVIKNESGARDDWLVWACDGRPLNMFLGGLGWRKWDFVRVLSGVVYETYSPARDKIGFRIRDKSVQLNRKLQTTTIGGSSANAGAPAPITFGKVFNAEAKLKDSATLRYKFHDETLAGSTGITQVRDSGVSVAYTADLPNGEFTLSAAPAGRITVDVTNDLSASSATRAGLLHRNALRTIIADRLGFGAAGVYSGLRVGSLDLFGANLTDQMGLYLPAEINVMDAIDAVAKSAGGFWYFNRLGQFCAALVRVPVAPFDHTLSVDDLRFDSFKIEKLFIPSDIEQLGFQQNFTVQADGIAGSVTAANRALYAAAAQYTTAAPSYSGLDQPSNHILRELPRNRDTLFVTSGAATTEATRMAAIFSKPCAIVSFETKVNAAFYNLGESVQINTERFGLTTDAQRAGIIVALEENFDTGKVTISLFIQLAGVFPITDIAEPYVTAGDFY